MNEDKKRRVTIYDVGRLAGVSHQTVSRVINNDSGVRPATKQAVLDAVETLGYRRRSAARSLASASSRTIALLSTRGAERGPTCTVLGVHQAAASRGLPVLSSILHRPTSTAIVQAIDVLLAEQPMCLVAVIDDDDHAAQIADFCRQDGVALVLCGGSPSHQLDVPRVALDQRRGGELAVAALRARGVQRVAFLPGPSNSSDATLRLDGVRGAARRFQIDLMLLPEGDWSVASGKKAASKFPRSGNFSLIAANDRMAIGAMQYLNAAGMSIPASVQIVGFDDESEAALVHPSLSSVQLGFGALGSLAVRAALRVAAGAPASNLTLPPRFVARESSLAPVTPTRIAK